jgi:hypothetical protein
MSLAEEDKERDDKERVSASRLITFCELHLMG